MKEKHVSLGYTDWEEVRFYQEVMLMLKNVKRQHCHKKPIQKPHVTKEMLMKIRNVLDLEDGEQLLVWTIAMVAFHSLARLGELVVSSASKMEQMIRLEHLVFHNVGKVPFATITLPHLKVHDPSLLAELVVHYTGKDTCPFSALTAFFTRRVTSGYAKGSAALFALPDGSVASRRWFLPLVQACLPKEGVSGHSFRAGGATEMALVGVERWIIQRMGRWSTESFERYIRIDASLFVALCTSAERNRPMSKILG